MDGGLKEELSVDASRVFFLPTIQNDWNEIRFSKS